eukprot:3591891-Amphidinium_carterae.1
MVLLQRWTWSRSTHCQGVKEIQCCAFRGNCEQVFPQDESSVVVLKCQDHKKQSQENIHPKSGLNCSAPRCRRDFPKFVASWLQPHSNMCDNHNASLDHPAICRAETQHLLLSYPIGEQSIMRLATGTERMC